MAKKPLYEIIYKEYRNKIKSGDLSPGDKLPTEKEISELFKVSRITATRALKELELRKYINRIKGSGSYVSDNEWLTDTNVQMEGRLSLISLILPFASNFSSEYLHGIEEIAKEHNYFVSFHNSHSNAEVEKDIIEDIISRGSHGVIVYPASSYENLDLYTSLLIDNYPFVLIDRNIPGLDISFVSSDNEKGFYDITNYLIGKGHERILFVGTSVHTLTSERERYKGYCKAHIDNSIPLMNNHIFTTKGEFEENTLNNFKDQAIEFFREIIKLDDEKRPTAIAAVNDDVAKFLIDIAEEHDINIPTDFAITGYDNEVFAEHISIPLTTVAQPTREIGRKAAIELFKIISNPDKAPSTVMIEGEIKKRKSA
jgi:DNA-binding LacI/PurR family transcriptional regulator